MSIAKNKKPAPGFYQFQVLSERYFDILLADLIGLFFLIFQPLAVAICTGFVWKGARTDPKLYFVLIFAAIFFGCVNTSREIVKEKAIWNRERLVGLKIFPYIFSKMWIQALLGFGQIILFYLGLRYFLVLDGNSILLVLVLYLALLAGMSLGMVISALVFSDIMALACVPIVLIPQLLFSKLILPPENLVGLVRLLEGFTLVKWSYQAIEQVVATSPDWGKIGEGLLYLLALSCVLTIASGGVLKMKDMVK